MNDNSILMTQAQYARHRNKSPQYIAKLVKAGTEPTASTFGSTPECQSNGLPSH